MELKEHRCSECGSSNLESYKDDKRIYIKCEDCGTKYAIYDIKKIPHELEQIKNNVQHPIRSLVPTLIGILVFTLIFALFCRYISGILGMPI